MNKHLHILHLKKRTDRLEHLMKQMEEQNITDYTIIEGIVDLASVFRGISNSHKKIVMLAMQKGMSNIIIAEDDICFFAPGSYDYFLNFVERNPDYDLITGMIYEGVIDENNRIVQNPYSFSGLTLYSVNKRFYERFLSMKDMAHLDKELGKYADKYKFLVCDKFVCKQMNGYSDQKKKVMYYDHLLKGRNLFGV